MADKVTDDVAPPNPPGRAPLQSSHAVRADRGRCANRIIARPGIGGGPARTPAPAAVTDGNGHGAARPKPRRV